MVITKYCVPDETKNKLKFLSFVAFSKFFKEYNLKMMLVNNKIIGYIDNQIIIDVDDFDFPYMKGGAGLGVNNGTLVTEQIIIN